MGPFEWLASRWLPEIKYGDHLMHEVEGVAWDCTVTGTRRGFLVGFSAGALAAAIIVGAAIMTGLYTPFPRTAAPRQESLDTTVAQAVREELNALRQDNEALKKQVGKGAVAANCPPCGPQATRKGPSEPGAAASMSQPTKQVMTKAIATPKASVAALGGQAAQASTPQRVSTPARETLPPTVPTTAERAEASPRAASLGFAIVEVRTSQGQFVPGVPIAFRFLDAGNQHIGGATVTTNPVGRSTTMIPAGTACAEYHLPAEYINAGRVKPEVSRDTGLPLAPGVFRTCGEILAHPNGIVGVFTID